MIEDAPVADHERVAGCARAGHWRRECPAVVPRPRKTSPTRSGTSGRRSPPVELADRARAREAAGLPQGEREFGLHRRRQRRRCVHDWHVRLQQQVVFGRDAVGRYTLMLGFTALVLRPEAVLSFISTPYDNR